MTAATHFIDSYLLTARFFRGSLVMILLAGGNLCTAAHAGVFEDQLKQALAASHQLGAAVEDWRKAREDVDKAYQSLEWSGTLNIVGELRRKNTNGGGYKLSGSNTTSVSASRSLYDGGLATASEAAAILTLEQAGWKVAETEQSVLYSAVSAYVSLVSARQRLALEETNVSRLEEHLRASQLRLEYGEATPTTVADTTARLARAEAVMISAETALAVAEANYKSIIGNVPEQLDMPSLPDLGITDAQQAAEQAGKTHPLLMQRFLAERLVRKNMDVVVAKVQPTIDIDLGASSLDGNRHTQTIEQVYAKVTLSTPLFPTHSVRAEARSRVAAHQSILRQRRDSERLVTLGAANSFRQYRAAQALISAVESELEAANLVWDGTIQEVEFGLKTILDQLDAEQDVVNAEVNRLEAVRDLVLAAYAVLRDTGQLRVQQLGLAGQTDLQSLPQPANPLAGIPPRLIYDETTDTP